MVPWIGGLDEFKLTLRRRRRHIYDQRAHRSRRSVRHSDRVSLAFVVGLDGKGAEKLFGRSLREHGS
jgi:hypothetical protein